MPLSRREAVGSLVSLPVMALLGATSSGAAADPEFAAPQPFSDHYVRDLARSLAAKPFAEATVELPQELANIGYDQYRDIRFDPQKRIWRRAALPFTFDVFHAGFLYKTPVAVSVAEAGEARQLLYNPQLFDFGPNLVPPPKETVLPFAGIRLRYPLNGYGIWDEFAVFLGASYFRATARGQVYGLSARGLAIGTAAPSGEEFPAFRAFWIHRPDADASSLLIDALLDSPSAAGAYRFTLRPGEITRFDVELALFPRRDLDHVGFAPLTSMFLFDATGRTRFDDFRRAVHDSNGLAMLTGKDEWLWRPLANGRTLQVSAFLDQGPRGFGLMQRARGHDDFLDLEARYERRPSCWVEPVGDWGAGHVELVEIPVDNEFHDNIVAYWRPRDPIPAGSEHGLQYRLHWCDRWPQSDALARTAATAQGLALNQSARIVVIDFVGGDLAGEIDAEVTASAGEISGVVVQPNPHTGGQRLKFNLDPKGEQLLELRALLKRGSLPVSETWLYQWTA